MASVWLETNMTDDEVMKLQCELWRMSKLARDTRWLKPWAISSRSARGRRKWNVLSDHEWKRIQMTESSLHTFCALTPMIWRRMIGQSSTDIGKVHNLNFPTTEFSWKQQWLLSSLSWPCHLPGLKRNLRRYRGIRDLLIDLDKSVGRNRSS